MILFLFLFLCCIIAAAVAPKNRAGTGFLLGLLLGPFGILIAILLRPDTTEEDQANLNRKLTDLNSFIDGKATTGLMLNCNDARSIMTVHKGSPAELVGIRSGDRLIAINGKMCDGDIESTILSIVGEPGDIVRLKIYRNTETTFTKGEKKTFEVDVVLA